MERISEGSHILSFLDSDFSSLGMSVHLTTILTFSVQELNPNVTKMQSIFVFIRLDSVLFCCSTAYLVLLKLSLWQRSLFLLIMVPLADYFVIPCRRHVLPFVRRLPLVQRKA